MVGFKNRYMVMEVSVDPNKDISKDDPIILSQHNVSKAIKDSILLNFGECGLASSLGSLQGMRRAFTSFVPLLSVLVQCITTCYVTKSSIYILL